MKNKAALFLLTSILCLLPMLLSIAVYNELPQQIAIHWDSAGSPDTFVPKAAAAFGLPFLFLALNIYSKLRLYNDPARPDHAHSQAAMLLSAWMPPLLSLVLIPITLCIAMGASIPIPMLASIFTGLVLVICGNYLPKCRQNYTIGIKLPWTLHDADNWNKTHRMAGYLWIAGGIALIAGAFVSIDRMPWGIPMTVFVLIPLVILPAAYSFMLYKRNRRKKR